MSFLTGYFLGLATAGMYLIGEAIYEAQKMKQRRNTESEP